LKSGACAIYDKDKVTPGKAVGGPTLRHADEGIDQGQQARGLYAGATLQLLGLAEPLETIIRGNSKRKGRSDRRKCGDRSRRATITRPKILRRFPGKATGEEAVLE
jgi:hypothetical protein